MARRSASHVFGRVVFTLCALIIVALAAFAVLAWHPALPARAEAAQPANDARLIADGERLATLGNCTSCHTKPDGPAYAGGLRIETPFGALYSTNITPDRQTGIGQWTQEAFARALRDGVDREGHDLYPAFPYDHYTHMRDGDVAALYAFLMSRIPVNRAATANELPFPYSFRPILTGWKLLFLKRGAIPDDPARSEVWNRGAYLTEALAHCGGCHTPRNSFGAEVSSRPLAGGVAEGWWSPPLDASSPALVAWNESSLFNYLRSWDSEHGGAVGPMADVTAGLARLPASDVHAIATYVASFSQNALDRTTAFADVRDRVVAPGDAAVDRGHAIYDGACAQCHESNGRIPFTTRSLAQHTSVQAPDPHNVLAVVMNGIAAPEGRVGAIMPAFANVLTDAQVADLLAYVRRRYSSQPAWADVPQSIKDARASLRASALAQ